MYDLFILPGCAETNVYFYVALTSAPCCVLKVVGIYVEESTARCVGCLPRATALATLGVCFVRGLAEWVTVCPSPPRVSCVSLTDGGAAACATL
jgi:hypothetical protein